MPLARGLFSPLAINFFPRDQSGFDGREINLLAVNLDLNAADEFAGEWQAPSRVPDLDQRLTLPVMRSLSVVAQRVG